MDLAPYGKPAFMDAMHKIVRLKLDGAYELDLAYFRYHQEQVTYQWTDGSPEFGDLFAPALETLLGPRRAPNDPLEDRHRDIARSSHEPRSGAGGSSRVAPKREYAVHGDRLVTGQVEAELRPPLRIVQNIARPRVAF